MPEECRYRYSCKIEPLGPTLSQHSPHLSRVRRCPGRTAFSLWNNRSNTDYYLVLSTIDLFLILRLRTYSSDPLCAGIETCCSRSKPARVSRSIRSDRFTPIQSFSLERGV